MNSNSYYDVACNDLEYLEICLSVIDKTTVYNGYVIQEQQVCEKFLKHLVQCYVMDMDVEKLLKSHKLYTLVNRLEKSLGVSLGLDSNMLRFLSNCYYDGRYPGVDYVTISKDEAKNGYETVKSVKAKVDWVLENYEPPLKQMNLFE